jgi:hypothetical protein
LLATRLGTLAAEPDASAGSAAREWLRQARTLSEQSFVREPKTNRQARFAIYRQLLPKLAAANAALQEATPSERIMLKVFRSAGTRPELLDELLAYYGHWRGPDGPRPRALMPAELAPQHLSEAYRPAWEALLLAPPNDEIRFMQQRSTVTEALAKIGNAQSIPVLELAFASTCAPEVFAGEGSAALHRQFGVLQSLNQFATAESLQAMLRCLALAEPAMPTTELPKVSGHDLREWLVRFLTDQDHYNTREKWRQVLTTFPTNDLPVRHRELLQRAAGPR